MTLLGKILQSFWFYLPAGYSVTHKKYRGQGILFGLMPVADEVVMGLGYPAVLSRMAITARTPVPALKIGNLFLGLIPKALKIPKLGWVSDIILFRDLSVKMTQPQIDQVGFFVCPSPVKK